MKLFLYLAAALSIVSTSHASQSEGRELGLLCMPDQRAPGEKGLSVRKVLIGEYNSEVVLKRSNVSAQTVVTKNFAVIFRLNGSEFRTLGEGEFTLTQSGALFRFQDLVTGMTAKCRVDGVVKALPAFTVSN